MSLMWAASGNFQPAELYERDVPTRELDFERPAVARCPEQYGLFFDFVATFPDAISP